MEFGCPLRDKLIHGYFGIDLELVWATATENLPPFVDQIRTLVAEV